MPFESAFPRDRHRKGRKVASRSASWIGIVLWIVVSPDLCRAADYYVDGSNPSCSQTGSGTEAEPYCSINAAVAAHNGPGQRIFVKPGVYREQVTVPSSGLEANPFTLQALGGTVLVDGADDFSSPGQWTQQSDDVYLAAGVTWTPLQVFMDGMRLKPSSSNPGNLPDSSFTWVQGDGLYVNAGGDNPGTHALLVGRRNYGFFASGKSWINIDGFSISHVQSRGIRLTDGCTDVVVSRDTVSFANSYGIQVIDGLRVLVEGCRSSDNLLHGIGLTAGSTACTLRANESFRNADPNIRRANGIHLYSAPGNFLEGNRLYENQDSGVHIGDYSSGCVAWNNRSWNNGDHGYDHLNAMGTTHIHDVAHGNYKDGFSIEGPSQNTHLHNCIATDNGLTTNRYDLWVDDTSSAGFISDFNIFWNETAQPPIRIGSSVYPAIAGYQSATGNDLHSLQADPLFVGASQGDFHLMPGSPAIDAGTSVVPGWPALDADGMARVDDPGTPNVGTGPVPFPDRGAFEFLTDQAPVVTAPPEATVGESDSIIILVSAADPDGDAIDSLTAVGLPAGATFIADPGDTLGTFRWTPTIGQAGSYTVRFVASGVFTGMDSTVITVTAATAGITPGGQAGPLLPPRIAPNPVRGPARLQFGTLRRGAVRVEIFDLTGRRVRTLMDDADAPAGRYELGFDLRPGGEASLSQGLYFFLIRTPDGIQRGRFTLVH